MTSQSNPSSKILHGSSPLAQAFQASRLYDSTHGPESVDGIEAVLEAERMIASATGQVAEELVKRVASSPLAKSDLGGHDYLWAGLVLIQQGKFADAAKHFEQAMVLGVRHWRLNCYLASALGKSGRIAEAFLALNEARQVAGDQSFVSLVQKELLVLNPKAQSHKKFRESKLAHQYLDGLHGLEIGGSAHNPFGLKSRNVDYCADIDTVFKKEEVRLCGEALNVDVVALGDELPLPGDSEDYVISSHVIEHFFDPIKAIKEWLRVVRPGGFVFIIAPHKERTFDKDRTRTPLQELLDRHSGKIPQPAVDTHEHYSVWITEDLLEVCAHLKWNVVEFKDEDDKVGNGFTLVIQKSLDSGKSASDAEPSELEAIAPKSVLMAPSQSGEHPLITFGESINLPGAGVDELNEPWYHDFSLLGLKTPQRDGIFPANQKCKQAILFPLIDEAVRLARKSGGKLRGIELFCADGYYGMYAMRQGLESLRGIDLNQAELSRARRAAKILGWGDKMTFDAEDVYQLTGDYDFCICAGGLYHLSDPGRLLSDLARKVHGPLVIQTVISLATTRPDYFESPAPGWTWGCRFSYGYLQGLMAKAGWEIVDCSENLLLGNERPDDRGSGYLLCVPPSYVQSGIAKKRFYNTEDKPNHPKDGALYDQPNKYARPSGMELGPETLIHGYQEFRLTANTVEPLSQDPPLERKRHLLSPVFDSGFLADKTLLDLGANGGFFTFWGRQKGAKSVVALDMDENYTRMIRTAQEHFGLNGIRTVSGRVQDWEEPADVVLAFALIHWLFSCTATYGSLDVAVGKLRSLTNELLVIEWVAPDDAAIAAFKHTDWNPSAVHGCYDLPAFEAALRRHFARIEIVGQTSGSRVLYMAWCNPREIAIDTEPPLIAQAERVISSRCLTEFQGKKYFSRVYSGEDGQSICKQATGDLAWRDAQLLRRLSGPHFPRVLEARQENGWSVAVFERIAGCELAQVIPEIAATPKTLANFFGDCLDIIEALQAAEITHRDIQTQNLMVRDGHPVLIDFGWAIAPDAHCFDPEALGGSGRPPDDSFCDVYSMGKTFSVCAPVNDQLFAPLISAMTAADPTQRITAVATLRKVLNSLTLPCAWELVPVFQSSPPKLKVGFLSMDPKVTACAYLRLTAPLNRLHALQKIEHLDVCDIENGRVKIDDEKLRKAQVIVVQRGMTAYLPYHVLRAAILDPAVKIVFELDDALTLLPPSHQAYAYFQSVRPAIEAYLRNADLVTVSTPKLKELYSHFNENIEVLPNTVDTQLWLPVPPKPCDDGKVRILFSGTLTHEHDLALIEQAIKRIVRKFPDRVEFLFWGNVPASLQELPQIKNVAEFTPDYPAYARKMKTLAVDLALVPLELTPFNRVKSPIKWLEYSVCKIPAIFTDIEAYNPTVEHGRTGWLVPNTAEAWYDAMKTLILDNDLRRSIAENAHQTILARHTLKKNTGLWVQAYEKVLALPPKKAASKEPKASIIIPTFNNLALTRQCLDSILCNTPQGLYEIVVVDNGSTDGTVAYLKEKDAAGEIRAVFNRRNGGFAQGCNQGARVARCSQLVFLNNDTVVKPGWLPALLVAAERPQAGVVGAKLLYPDGRLQHAGIEFINGVPDHPYRFASADAPEVNVFREMDMVTGACFLIGKDLFHSLAGFDEIYQNGVEDVDLCLRVRAAGLTVAYEPKAVVYHHEGKSAGRFNHVKENLTLFFQRWGKSFDGKMRFVMPQLAEVSTASRSVMLATASAPGDAKAIAVAWEGSFLDHGSLSHVNRELTHALSGSKEIKLQRVGNGAQTSPAFKDLAREVSATASNTTAITVRHAWPPNWQRPRKGALVVIQPWEFGSLPEEWVQKSSAVDEFWVPSNYVRNVYIGSGVPANKVVVVPNGIDPGKFNPQAAPMKLATTKKFKFLFVGGTIHRKGPDLLLKAYLQSFTAADDVCLVIKDFGGESVYAGQTFVQQIRAAQSKPGAPEILYINEELPPESLPGLYTACNCFVLPYRGEGFGLPVLEAMGCGLPVIVSGGGATDDFVRDEFAYRIPAERRAFGREVSGMKLAGQGWLLEPNVAALGQLMRRAFTNPAEAHERGRVASKHAHQFCSWTNPAAIITQRARDLIGRADLPGSQDTRQRVPTPKAAPVKATPITLPACALVGHLGEARELIRQKKLPAAWHATLAALEKRPFHPEACLLLAEIAQSVGDGQDAKLCAEYAKRIAPGIKAAKKFLNQRLPGGSRPGWLALPPAIADNQSPVANGRASNITHQTPRLTVGVLTKNEEKLIAQCLNSVKGLADQIIVVDTGSTDRTIEIAKSLGAEVYSTTWDDDFSAPRNAILEHATGDWILMLDADEELPDDQHAALLRDIQKADTLACRLPLVNEGQNDGRNFVPRLFRNAPGTYYCGRIHEQVFPSLIPSGKSWGMSICRGTAQLLHHGYTQELVKDRNKIERNLRLLKLAVAERPNDANLVMNLGLEMIRSGDLAEGLVKYREAFRLLSAQAPADVVSELREVLLTQFTAYLCKDRQYDEVVRVLNSPLAKHGGLTASLHFTLGLANFEFKHYREAAEHLRQCLAKRKQPVLSPINTDILTAAPGHCLAMSLAQLGDFAGAEKAFTAALQENGEVEAVKLDYARFLAQQNRPVEALQKLHELATKSPNTASAWKLGAEIGLKSPEFLEFASDWTGEAIRALPNDPAILVHRGEALLLSQQTSDALVCWQRACQNVRSPNALAAFILCAAVESQPIPQTCDSEEEMLSSKAFIDWYQRLVRMGAERIVVGINSCVEEWRASLPTAAGLLDDALAEAGSALAEAK